MTNEWMETTEFGVYAIGDIVGGMPQLAHVGSMAGLVVAAKMAGKYAKGPSTARAFPGARIPIRSDRERRVDGDAGEGEGAYQVKTGKFPFVGNSKATILDAHDGLY